MESAIPLKWEWRFCLGSLLDGILGEYRYAGVNVFGVQCLAFQYSHSSFDTFITHDIRVLGHYSQEVAVPYQLENGVGLVKAYTDDAAASFPNGVAGANSGTFVSTEDAHDALGDVVRGYFLGPCCIAFAVLGFEDFKVAAFEGCSEALSRSTVDMVAGFTLTIPILPDVIPLSASVPQGLTSDPACCFVVCGQGFVLPESPLGVHR